MCTIYTDLVLIPEVFGLQNLLFSVAFALIEYKQASARQNGKKMLLKEIERMNEQVSDFVKCGSAFK